MRNYLLYGSEEYAVAIMRPLQKAIRARGDKAAWFFDGPGAKHLREDETLLSSIKEIKAFNPTAIFAPGNVIPHFLPGVKVQVFHGFNAGKPRHIYIRGFFDIYCTTGPADTMAFKELAKKKGHFAVYETGWPKLDSLNEIKKGNGPESKLDDGRPSPTILYHSTFSPSWSAAKILYPTLKELFKKRPDWHWLISFHPKMDLETVELYRNLQGPNVKYCVEDNILEIQAGADLMISDTSSALHEFLMQIKPVVTFNNRAPGSYLMNVTDPTELEPAILTALGRPPELMANIKTYADATHPYRDGKSSERILAAVDDFLETGMNRKLAPKPFNLWRKLKVRLRLKHFSL